MIPRSRSRSRLVLFTLLFIAVLSASGFTALFLSDAVTDAAPVRDWDLISPYAAAPDAENGYLDFWARDAPMRTWPFESLQRVMRLNAAKDLDLLAARESLAGGKDLLELFTRCASKPRFQAPGTEIPSLYGLRRISEIASLRAAVLHAEGNDEEALDIALDIVRLGNRICLDAREFLTFVVGSCIQSIGYLRMHALVRECDLAPAALIRYVKELSELSGSVPLFRECRKREYTDRAGTIDRVAAGRESPQSLSDVSPVLFRIPLVSRVLLKPNLTKEALAGEYRRLIENAGKPLAGVNRGDFLVLCETQLGADATRLLFALRAFLADRGRLPEALEELAPEFIDAIPVDPYDGKPLRYCPEAGVFYSVGGDLEDRGGGEKWWDWQEPTFFIGARRAPVGD